jgi:hypothetical protein
MAHEPSSITTGTHMSTPTLTDRIPRDLLAVPPIDVESIASSLGVRQIIRNDIGCDGMLHPISPGRFVIFLNVKHNQARQRFSCAHEVAHILISADHPQLESACDSLAAEILMPRPLFAAHAASLSWQLSSIPTLSSTFLTSIEATAHRYVETINEACSLFTWKLDSQSSDKGIKLCSFHKNRKVRSQFFQIDGNALRLNKMLLTEPKGARSYSGGYERVRISHRGRDSFDTLYMETLTYGFGTNRRVINAIYPGRRGAEMFKRRWTNRVNDTKTSTEAERIGHGE